MEDRLLRELFDGPGEWSTTLLPVRSTILVLNDALRAQADEIKSLKQQLNSKVSVTDYEANNAELRSCLRKKVDLDFLEQQLDNKANVIDMYTVMKTNFNDFSAKLNEKAPLSVLDTKASKTAVASALRKKYNTLDVQMKSGMEGMALQVSSLKDGLNSLAARKDPPKPDEDRQVKAERMEVQKLRKELQESLKAFAGANKATENQVSNLSKTVHDLAGHVNSLSNSATRNQAAQEDMWRNVHRLKDHMPHGLEDNFVKKKELQSLVQKEIGAPLTKLADMQSKLQTLNGHLQDRPEREKDATLQLVHQMREEMRAKADLKDIENLKTVIKSESKQLLMKAMSPIIQQMEESAVCIDKFESELRFLNNECDRKATHADILGVLDSKADTKELAALNDHFQNAMQTYNQSLETMAQNHTDLSCTLNVKFGELDRDCSILAKNLAGKLGIQDVEKFTNPELVQQNVTSLHALCMENALKIDSLQKKVKSLGMTTEQASESLIQTQQQLNRHPDLLELKRLILMTLDDMKAEFDQIKDDVANLTEKATEYQPLQTEYSKTKIDVTELKTLTQKVVEDLGLLGDRIENGLKEAKLAATSQIELEKSGSMSTLQSEMLALLAQKVDREDMKKELFLMDQFKVNRKDLEQYLSRKVDENVMYEKLAAKANHTELHQWAEDLTKEINRRLSVKTDWKQFEMLAKEVDNKLNQDNVDAIVSRALNYSSLIQNGLTRDTSSIEISLSSPSEVTDNDMSSPM